MKKIITQETLDKVLNCIVRAIHPNSPYIYVDQLIGELTKLPEENIKEEE